MASGQLALVLGAGSEHPPRQDLAPLGHEGAEQLDVLVVDVVDLVRAELADLAPAEEVALAALLAAARRPRRRPRRRAATARRRPAAAAAEPPASPNVCELTAAPPRRRRAAGAGPAHGPFALLFPGGALRLAALGLLQLLVDAHGEEADDAVGHPDAALDFLDHVAPGPRPTIST